MKAGKPKDTRLCACGAEDLAVSKKRFPGRLRPWVDENYTVNKEHQCESMNGSVRLRR